ncbi:MAG TPA: hypothetical protein VGK25_12795 [Ignavibacteria bacterium]
MSNYKAKYIISLLILLGLAAACTRQEKDKQSTEKQQQTKDTVKINKDQYRVAEIFTDSKDQIIDLIQGPATFEIMYQGDSHFRATLMYPDGRVVAVLAEVDGSYKGKKKIDIPETTAYILDVNCKGQWSVYRE